MTEAQAARLAEIRARVMKGKPDVCMFSDRAFLLALVEEQEKRIEKQKRTIEKVRGSLKWIANQAPVTQEFTLVSQLCDEAQATLLTTEQVP